MKFFTWLFLTLSVLSMAAANEGMWLFNDPPLDAIEKEYGVRLTPELLEHLQKSSVRFSNGGSGSFISPDGLVMTNHHVAFSAVNKLSTPEHPYTEKGFFADTPEQEAKCPDLELVQLEEIVDVTDRIRAAEESVCDEGARPAARRQEIARIESEAMKSTGLFCEVMTFYRGGLYHLYEYRRFNDVRLVFAPEENVGYFGGETDNFEYPRYNLDLSFFRVYVDGQPYRPEHWLRWSPAGAQEDELVLVSGHPGRTERLDTTAHLEFLRDSYFPFFLDSTRRQELTLGLYRQRGEKQAQSASADFFRIQNTHKAKSGILLGLQTPWMIDLQKETERLQRAGWRQRYPGQKDPWTVIEQALAVWRGHMSDFAMLEEDWAFQSSLYKAAKQIVRLAAEQTKPDAERFPEYRSTTQESTRRMLLTPGPIDPEREKVQLADSFGFCLERLAPTRPEIRSWLGGESPKGWAAKLIDSTRLTDFSFRKELLDGGWEKVQACDDPMIRFALMVDPIARKLRAEHDSGVVEPMQKAYTDLALFRFQTHPYTCYPDATFTLRLSYGKVAGLAGIPAMTTIAGAYAHAEEHRRADVFSLSDKWFDHRAEVDETTPLNFISTNDIIGGNSGSPVVNVKGEVVGLIFDGNVDSLSLDFLYSEKSARAVSVHSSGIREILTKIYGVDLIP